MFRGEEIFTKGEHVPYVMDMLNSITWIQILFRSLESSWITTYSVRVFVLER